MKLFVPLKVRTPMLAVTTAPPLLAAELLMKLLVPSKVITPLLAVTTAPPSIPAEL